MGTRPLTIVHVSGFPFGLRRAPHHSVELKLSNGLIRLGHLVLNFSDKDVARAKSLFGSRKYGVKPANRALLEFCRFHRPDVLLCGHADVILPETLAAIREAVPGVKIGQWNVDPLFEPDNIARFQTKLPVVDASFVTTAGAPLQVLRDGRWPISFMPNPTDQSIERGRCDLNPNLPFDLFYNVGNPVRPKRHICGQDYDMNDFMSELLARLPHIRPLLAGALGTPLVFGAAYQSALESAAIGLNFSRRPDHYLYSSDRIAQFAGNGMVVCIERATGYGDLFGEDEMVFFSSIDELVEKIARLSADITARMRLAEAGRAKYVAKFNERAVAGHLLAVLLGEAAPEEMNW
jgi:hypothetical protein